MTTCPWCGTNYAEFQSKCDSCGGSLPLPAASAPSPLAVDLPVPPPAPRRLPRNYVWRILSTDGWAIAAAVFVLMGVIFGLVGGALTISIVAAFVGVPFLGRIPIDPEIVACGDSGTPFAAEPASSLTAEAFAQAIEPILTADTQTDRNTFSKRPTERSAV